MSKVRDSACGETCTVRLDCCNHDPTTTVLAHVGHHGSAKRNHDDEAVYACSDCHDAIDGRSRYFLSHNADQQRKMHIVRDLEIRRALRETHRRMLEKGLMPK